MQIYRANADSQMSGSTGAILTFNSGADFVVSNCIIKGPKNTSTDANATGIGMTSGGGAGPYYFWNNLFDGNLKEISYS
jgi:hypothetical protein